VVGYGEPSLDFALGGQTEAMSPEDAATALRVTGRPVIVEARQEDAFLAAIRADPPRRAAEVEGYDYAAGSTIRLVLYAPAKR
jgi:hypothetical protein